MNPSEIERLGTRVFFLYRLREGTLRWFLDEDDLPDKSRFVARIVAGALSEAIEVAKGKGLLG